jgi:hypothetical protein
MNGRKKSIRIKRCRRLPPETLGLKGIQEVQKASS